MRTTRLAALAASTLLLATACGGSDHNDADVEFAQTMIPHHEQAVEMARQAATHDAGPEVRALAVRIEKAQGPEIEQLTGWLDDWDQKAAHGMGHDMDGMMSDSDMKALDTARGDAFDRLFLTQMIEHHQGAVEMAKAEVADGQDEDAQKLARAITTSQTSEITEMRDLLADR